jgi:hypothetical protein
MSWTYDPASEAPLDVVRWLVADTDPTDPLQQDEEITRVLTRQPHTYRAAAGIARQIARQFARQCDLDIAREVRISLSDRSKQYYQMARDLEDEANKGAGGRGGVGVFVGGISVAQIDAEASKTDRVPPAFTRTLHETTTEREAGEGLPESEGV